LFIPQGRKTPGPALLFFHGGPTNRQCFAAWDPFETHTHLYEANQYLANRGYVILSVNYRGGAGYGLNFREAKGFGAGGASELNDIIAAANYMKTRPEVDPKRLGVWGGSYGGRMVSLALSRASEFFAAGADYAGVHDWTRMPEWRPADPETTRLAFDSSAIAHVDTWRAPVLLMQADADMSVPFEQTAVLLSALRARGIPVETLSLPDEVHFLLRHSSWNMIFEATREYMDRHLQGAKQQ
jgi:dipeptidyl aminopeptidase/acylaminoacyl peptidase